MKAVVTTGHGGYEQLVYRDVPVPTLAPGEVLLQVLAAGVNNTDINTRLGWYGAAVTTATQDAALAHENQSAPATPDGGWNQATPFPFIQGTDCCGRVVAVAPGVREQLLGLRVLVRPSMRPSGFDSQDNIWMGSDFDGAFAHFVKVPADEVFAVNCDWSDAELATIPCAYGTAENMLQRAQLGQGEQVVVTGASGGVGSAVVQLAKRRGAFVTAIVGRSKMAQIKALGADLVLAREDDWVASLGENTVDLVVDNVAGPAFGTLLKLLKPGGRYVSSGAIAGPLVTLDMRTLYLKNLTLLGCTAWAEPVFANLVGYIERGELRPLVAQSFALDQIAQAQRAFLDKTHVGKFVLIPPPPDGCDSK
ncbi:MAG: alcohol dehydrogenase family protein [Gammaproteobacteria bacterium]|nr:zinc-binding dehydrogenase [Rhodoferax sp.]MBU3900741.1 alcohol dehydrogenase family protein [Gammaproteobacteria bacterium]MBU3997181.1 alcohol dehydrogenase family protein [Gammaproteobacteria bacterium]MBU4079492.1 alcohol dehydrogenase family protein [Gammaproteobacteria bacterium]MBU4114800.1 alcohol dehydrogenase family protein [Gammaproteobacteria bacterium]